MHIFTWNLIRMKKSFIIVFFLLGLILFGFSRLKKYQKINILNLKKEKFSLGYYITSNLFTFNIKPNIISLEDNLGFVPVVIPKFGFSIGLINNFNINNYIDLRFEPIVHFTQRKLNFRHIINYINMKYINNLSTLNIMSSDIESKINSIYLDLPIFFKLNGDLYYKYRPYIMAGFSCMLNLIPFNNFIQNYNLASIFKFKKINFTVQSEIGIEFFFKQIKFTPSFRSIIFLNNEIIHNNLHIEKLNYLFDFSNNLKFISSQVWMISIKFE